jgi:hypothetical protein
LKIEDIVAPENLARAARRVRRDDQFMSGGEVARHPLYTEGISKHELPGLCEDIRELLLAIGDGVDVDCPPVLPLRIRTREVYAHDHTSRFMQQAVVEVLATALDPLFCPGAHAYRRQRDRFTGLLSARRSIRRGLVHAARVDVANFFRSISSDQCAKALRKLGISDERIIRLCIWFCTAPIWNGDPSLERRCGPILFPPGRLTPPLHALYQGSIIAPLLSNAVASVELDLPFKHATDASAKMIRYADDILILASDPQAAAAAFRRISSLIHTAGWSLNHDKTVEMHDLRDGPIVWLRKSIGERDVRTLPDKLEERISAFLGEPDRSPLFRTMASALVAELFLDPLEVVQQTIQSVTAHSPRHGRQLERSLSASSRRRRMRQIDRAISGATGR